MFTMPLAPLVVNKTSGDWMWTAASVLALHASPLAFDPALDVDFDAPGDEDVKRSGLSMLERYVARLLAASFDDSSLFWHYALRHVPSPSLVCARNYSANRRPSGTSMAFVNDAQVSELLNSPNIPENYSFLFCVIKQVPSDASNPDILQQVGGIPMHGYGAFPLGGAKSMCFCGWPSVSSTLCRIPNATCRAVLGHDSSSSETCTYHPDTDAGRSVLARIIDAWAASGADWECPEIDLSDAWGVVSAKDADAWIASSSSSSANTQAPPPAMRISELLRAGRAGLRIGNAKTLARSARADGVWPTARVHRLLPADDLQSTGAALNRCSDTILASFDAASVAREVVDDLFPAAQGIHESAPMSFCLRFAIEFSRLRVLKAMRSVASGQHVLTQIMLQKSVVDQWRGRWVVVGCTDGRFSCLLLIYNHNFLETFCSTVCKWVKIDL